MGEGGECVEVSVGASVEMWMDGPCWKGLSWGLDYVKGPCCCVNGAEGVNYAKINSNAIVSMSVVINIIC